MRCGAGGATRSRLLGPKLTVGLFPAAAPRAGEEPSGLEMEPHSQLPTEAEGPEEGGPHPACSVSGCCPIPGPLTGGSRPFWVLSALCPPSSPAPSLGQEAKKEPEPLLCGSRCPRGLLPRLHLFRVFCLFYR